MDVTKGILLANGGTVTLRSGRFAGQVLPMVSYPHKPMALAPAMVASAILYLDSLVRLRG